jgi:uncharacterized OB-fold protein
VNEPTPAWQDIVVPPQDTTTQPWWDATREHRLVLQTCRSCRSVQHPPRSVCLSCMSEDLTWSEASGAATVDAWTTVHRSPEPDVVVPYVIARVRLAEGPLMLTQIVDVGPAQETSRCDQPVRLSWAALADGRALPVFVATTNELEN